MLCDPVLPNRTHVDERIEIVDLILHTLLVEDTKQKRDLDNPEISADIAATPDAIHRCEERIASNKAKQSRGSIFEDDFDGNIIPRHGKPENESSKIRRVVISGAPGCGKSTLSRQTCKDSSSRMLCSYGSFVVILLSQKIPAELLLLTDFYHSALKKTEDNRGNIITRHGKPENESSKIRVVISGAPGCGRSTLSRQICKDLSSQMLCSYDNLVVSLACYLLGTTNVVQMSCYLPIDPFMYDSDSEVEISQKILNELLLLTAVYHPALKKIEGNIISRHGKPKNESSKIRTILISGAPGCGKCTVLCKDLSSRMLPSADDSVVSDWNGELHSKEPEVMDAVVPAESLIPLDKARFIHVIDSGGQPAFQDILPLLLATPCTYIQVFGASKDLDEPKIHCIDIGGTPGCGKSTLLQQLWKDPSSLILCSDVYSVVSLGCYPLIFIGELMEWYHPIDPFAYDPGPEEEVSQKILDDLFLLAIITFYQSALKNTEDDQVESGYTNGDETVLLFCMVLITFVIVQCSISFWNREDIKEASPPCRQDNYVYVRYWLVFTYQYYPEACENNSGTSDNASSDSVDQPADTCKLPNLNKLENDRMKGNSGSLAQQIDKYSSANAGDAPQRCYNPKSVQESQDPVQFLVHYIAERNVLPDMDDLPYQYVNPISENSEMIANTNSNSVEPVYCTNHCDDENVTMVVTGLFKGESADYVDYQRGGSICGQETESDTCIGSFIGKQWGKIALEEYENGVNVNTQYSQCEEPQRESKQCKQTILGVDYPVNTSVEAQDANNDSLLVSHTLTPNTGYDGSFELCQESCFGLPTPTFNTLLIHENSQLVPGLDVTFPAFCVPTSDELVLSDGASKPYLREPVNCDDNTKVQCSDWQRPTYLVFSTKVISPYSQCCTDSQSNHERHHSQHCEDSSTEAVNLQSSCQATSPPVGIELATFRSSKAPSLSLPSHDVSQFNLQSNSSVQGFNSQRHIPTIVEDSTKEIPAQPDYGIFSGESVPPGVFCKPVEDNGCDSGYNSLVLPTTASKRQDSPLRSNKKEAESNQKSLLGDSKNEKPPMGSDKCDVNISVNQTVVAQVPSETIFSQQSSEVAACLNKTGEAEIHFATDKHLNSNYSVCRPVGIDQLSVNNPPGDFDQVDVNECKSIDPWSSKELGRREPPVGEELEDLSPLPLQPKPHGAGKITTPIAVASNRLQASGKSHSHPKPSYHPKPAEKVTPKYTCAPVTVATDTTGCLVHAHRSPDNYDNYDHAFTHTPYNPRSNTTHPSKQVIGKVNNAVNLLKEWKNKKRFEKKSLGSNFKLLTFLESLRLERLCPTSFHTELPLYLTKRARLESMFKELGKWFTDESVGTVLSFLKPEWIGSEEIAHIRQQFTKSPRVGWNTLKKSPRIVELINLNVLSHKLGVPRTFPLNPTVDEFDGIIDEVVHFLQEKSNDQLRLVHLVDALFQSEADEAFIDDMIFQDPSKPSVTQLKPVAEYLVRTGKWRKMLPLIHDSIHDLITEEPSRYGRSTPQALHCLGLWLATGAESSNPLTWEDVCELLYKIHVTGEDLEELGVPHNLENVSNPKVKGPWDSRAVPNQEERNDEEILSEENRNRPEKVNGSMKYPQKPALDRSTEEQTGIESTDQPPPPVHVVKDPSAVFEKSSFFGSRQTLHGGSDDEAALLSKKLDPGNPKSILAHAKSVYLTADYNRTREILENFNHHLTVEGKMLRAKIFGLGICHYREKDYPAAVKYLDELERVALEHNAAGDVAVSFIYRGEIHLAQGKYQTAYEMFTRARTAYDTDHVAHLFGIVILSKTSVIIKAANCQKHLKNISKAKELFHTAVDLAVRARESVESSSTSHDHKHAGTLRALYKDEIAARTSLGNLHQNTSDCSKSLEEYRLALNLQKKVDTKCIAYGWAQGNMGSALVGRGKVKEAIPHLTEAYDIAKKFERDYSAVGRAANNLGTAFQADKQYSQAEDYFQIALGHSVYCKDEVGQARSLGNIGNVKLLQGELMEALRCYTETLSLSCDENALITAYQNRAGVYIALAKQLARGNDWDEVSSDVESVQPKEIQSAEIPVQECTEHHPTENRRLQLVAPVGTYTPLPLDDEEDILNKKQSSPAPSFERGRTTDPIRHQPLTAFDVLHPDDLTVKHRKYYLERAKEDLLQSVELIEKKFDTLKGEDTNTLALSLFEVNAKAFYNLQKVLVLLGDPQGALKVAEQNRGRNLGEILWNKRQRASNMPRPLDLRHIWRVVNRERTPVIVLSYIQQSSTMLVHMVFPRAKSDSFCRGEEGTDFYRESGGPFHSEDHPFHTSTIFHTPALANGSDDDSGSQIPPDNYHFMKVHLPKEDFLNKNYGPFSRDNKEENVSFDQFVTKTLMNYLNQREIELFTPIDYQDDESPLTILFEKITRRFVEVLEHKFPEEREIIVIADQAAHFFPWPLLQDESTKVFLGDRYRVRTYPSILTMGVINHQKPRTIELPSEESFLVVGNPATPKFQHGGKEVTLGRLPHSETEALQVAHILETTPLLKEMATKPSVLYRLQTAQIIHIATHSSAVHGYLAFASSVPIVNSAKPVDSKEALIFIDEIQKLLINASLVVLSACDSARGQLVNEGVNSVARAFLAAGAQSVLVSLVRVPDKSASIFMSMFYRFLTHNEFTTSEAMQKSSMAIRCIKTLSQHIHWGGFQLVGRNIRMKYNKDCHPAKVAALVGETSPFPQLGVVQELEKAIFRQDRTPPRDVVLVKGMTAHDPAEIVRDFVVKRSKLFPGGVFWYNCSTPELLEASVTSVKKTLPHLKTIGKDPPKQTKRIDRKESMDPVPLFVEHYRLIILDSPFSLEECTRAIPDLKDQEVDIVIIDNMEANRDRKLSNFADSVLIRGCATIEVSDIDRYTSIQRMAYRLLCEQEFCPYEEDYEAFETIVSFCRGSSVLVKVFEGLLTSKEKGVLQSIARDIEQVKEMVISYGDTHTSHQQQASFQSSHQSGSLASSLSSFPKEVGKKVGRLGKKAKEAKLTPAKNGLVESYNGLITADFTKQLSDEDCVLLSEGIEKVPRVMGPFCNFLSLRLSTEAHSLLQFLSYISGYPNVDSERPFVFLESFVNELSTIVANSTQSFSSSAIIEELRRMNLILLYPQPVLSPPERAADENLFYIPDIIVRIATYDVDEADIAFILNVSSAVLSQTNGLPSPAYYTPVQSRNNELMNIPQLQSFQAV